MKKRALIIILLSLLMLNFGCSKSATENDLLTSPYKKSSFLMGTIVTVKIYDKDKEEALDAVFHKIESLAEQITANDEASAVDAINNNAGVKAVPVSDDLYALVEAGKAYSEKADGSFDITIGPLTSLWHIGFPDERKPNQAEIDEVLPLINYKQIQLNKAEKTVFLQDEGMALDMGAIAKGFITDEVIKVLQQHNVSTAIIDLGGNIYVMGNNPNGSAWTVGIQDPFQARGELVGKIRTTNKSIVTSGVYERYLEVDGTRYHHLLNPKDGYPFNNEIAGVSIISDHSIDGDALSTSIFAKGLEAGMKYMEQFEGAEAVFVTHDKNVYTTSGLTGELEITNDSFTLSSLH